MPKNSSIWNNINNINHGEFIELILNPSILTEHKGIITLDKILNEGHKNIDLNEKMNILDSQINITAPHFEKAFNKGDEAIKRISPQIDFNTFLRLLHPLGHIDRVYGTLSNHGDKKIMVYISTQGEESNIHAYEVDAACVNQINRYRQDGLSELTSLEAFNKGDKYKIQLTSGSILTKHSGIVSYQELVHPRWDNTKNLKDSDKMKIIDLLMASPEEPYPPEAINIAEDDMAYVFSLRLRHNPLCHAKNMVARFVEYGGLLGSRNNDKLVFANMFRTKENGKEIPVSRYEFSKSCIKKILIYEPIKT